ncbi:hypothetical protein DVH24_030807 [Malus domestica]|uniref:Uncharacterized protein n=1 Tax=Malus domestica TaxID=3750 RepID=A0A498HDX2_MALDO|nr:hypothetical protein DVH24_030807 [Malus domestica]
MDENVHLRLEELLFTTPVGLVVVLCLVYVNFGIDLDLLNDLMGRNYITEQLPSEFYDTLKNKRSCKSVSLDVNVLAAALKMQVLGPIVQGCVQMLSLLTWKANQSRDDIFRKLFRKPPVQKASRAGSCSRVYCATNSEEVKTGALH